MRSPAPASSRSLFRHPDFLKLWTGETISQFGTQISLLAIPFVALGILHATPFEYGLLGTVEFLPFILFTLPAGAWIDRLRRRPVLIVGDLGRAVSLASIPIAYELGVLTIWQLFVVGFVNGVLTVFFDVAYQSYLPSLVDRDQIVDGNSKLEVSRSAAQIGGPGIAGFLVGIVGAPVAIIGDAVSFVVSAVAVILIRHPEATPDRHVDEHGRRREGLRREVASGLRYVLGNRYLRSIAASTGWSNLFSSILFVALFPYMLRDLGLEAQAVGLVFAVGNVGALVGALAANRVARWLGVGWAIVLAMFLSGPQGLLVALAPRDAAVPILIVSLGLGGISQMVYNINQVSFRQAITPGTIQGRMNATMRFIVWGTIPIGSILGGALGTVVGLHATIWIGAIGGALAFLPLLIGPLRSLRMMPEPVDGAGAAATTAAEATGIGADASEASTFEGAERRHGLPSATIVG
ncbi:MAG TPA: MFS transporter, partial [Candidatus Dormibacteraeota bacterium]|nr:MFS transporter [Candidatus Dormibacteraeota bacterium]